MNRRILLKHLFPAFGVSVGLGGAAAAAGPTLVAAVGPVPGNLPAPDPSVPEASVPEAWLEHWQRLPMRPLVGRGDLEDGGDPRVRSLALTILGRLGGGEPLAFRYFGGSESGAVRAALPVMLFRKFDPDLAECGSGAGQAPGPVYLLAHCLKREAPRTFRLERMEMAAG